MIKLILFYFLHTNH